MKGLLNRLLAMEHNMAELCELKCGCPFGTSHLQDGERLGEAIDDLFGTLGLLDAPNHRLGNSFPKKTEERR